MSSCPKLLIFNLNYQLHKRGWTQKDLSKKTKISEPTISGYMTGKIVPGLAMLDTLAEALEIPAFELILPPIHSDEFKKPAEMSYAEAIFLVRELLDRLSENDIPSELQQKGAMTSAMKRVARTEKSRRNKP